MAGTLLWMPRSINANIAIPWTPALVLSPLDPATLYLGTQYVMKTVDGGLHWETISPDLTGAIPRSRPSPPSTDDAKPASAPTLENAKRAGYGVVFTIAPSPLNRDLIWAGSDTGLIHITRDGGKNWNNVTPPGSESHWSQDIADRGFAFRSCSRLCGRRSQPA